MWKRKKIILDLGGGHCGTMVGKYLQPDPDTTEESQETERGQVLALPLDGFVT